MVYQGFTDILLIKVTIENISVYIFLSLQQQASTPSISRWDETPGRAKGSETPGATPSASTRVWENTPAHLTPGHVTPGHATPGHATPGHATPGHSATPSARRNRWDETPRTERGT